MGLELSEERIQELVAEAEAGYDLEVAKRRGRGRPGRGTEPMQVIAVRLTEEELSAVDELARRRGQSRSDTVRQALAMATDAG